MVVKAVI